MDPLILPNYNHASIKMILGCIILLHKSPFARQTSISPTEHGPNIPSCSHYEFLLCFTHLPPYTFICHPFWILECCCLVIRLLDYNQLHYDGDKQHYLV